MKFEIVKAGEAVEIRIAEDDGSFTVWLCDNEQTAIYKLVSLLFSRPEDEKKLRRSILVGTFEPKKVEKKKTMEELADESAKRLAKSGLVRKGSVTAHPAIGDEQMKELLDAITKKFIYDPALPMPMPFAPSIPNYPGITPSGGQPIPMMPYIGDVIPSWPGVGTVNYTVAKTIPSDVKFNSIADVMGIAGDGLFANPMKMNECAVGTFKTTMGATVNVYKACNSAGGNL